MGEQGWGDGVFVVAVVGGSGVVWVECVGVGWGDVGGVVQLWGGGLVVSWLCWDRVNGWWWWWRWTTCATHAPT